MRGPSGVRGDGGSIISMPATYTATVREFERLKAALKQSEPVLHWHLVHWHIRVVRTQKWLPRSVKRRNRKVEWLLEPRIIIHRHKSASQTQAAAAIGWMADRWGLTSEPMLPNELVTPGEALSARPEGRAA